MMAGSTISAFANPPEVVPNGNAILIIESKSSDILFYIDDSLYSRQRKDTLTVSSGYHSLRASNIEADLWSALDWSWNGTLNSDSTYYFEIVAKRFLIINSIPFGADVIIDGKFMGTTPYVLESSENAVELIKSNFMPVRIEPEEMIEKTIININMVVESPAIESEIAPTFANLGYDRDKLINRSTYAFTAISGIAAVYFKFEADKAFNNLSDAIDPADIRYFSDRVDKYDNYAAFSFGTFQAGFLYSIYRVIRHR